MLGTLKERFAAAFAAASRDNIGILAAGVAYYAFLAFVPLLAATVLGYGIIAEPDDVARHIQSLASMLPQSAAELIGGQLEAVVETSSGKKGLGLLLALTLALIGARNGAASIATAVGLAYNREQQRSFLHAAAVALAITLGAITGAGLVVVALTATAALGDLLPHAGGAGVLAVQALTYAILLAASVGGAAALYRFAPPGPRPAWRSVLAGAVFAGAGLLLLTMAFGFYVANFGSYNATYGSLGAVIVLLTWLYLAAYVLLFGAELNAVGHASGDGVGDGVGEAAR